jgi:hypothetical protein
MTYLSLGPIGPIVAVKDTSTLNAGNLTAALTQDVIAKKVSTFELYHVAITDVPSDTTLTLYVGQHVWSVAQLSTIGDWDPSQPMLLHPGDDVWFCFNKADGTTPVPKVTAWFRYDSAFPNN